MEYKFCTFTSVVGMLVNKTYYTLLAPLHYITFVMEILGKSKSKAKQWIYSSP